MTEWSRVIQGSKQLSLLRPQTRATLSLTTSPPLQLLTPFRMSLPPLTHVVWDPRVRPHWSPSPCRHSRLGSCPSLLLPFQREQRSFFAGEYGISEPQDSSRVAVSVGYSSRLAVDQFQTFHRLEDRRCCNHRQTLSLADLYYQPPTTAVTAAYSLPGSGVPSPSAGAAESTNTLLWQYIKNSASETDQ